MQRTKFEGTGSGTGTGFGLGDVPGVAAVKISVDPISTGRPAPAQAALAGSQTHEFKLALPNPQLRQHYPPGDLAPISTKHKNAESTIVNSTEFSNNG